MKKINLTVLDFADGRVYQYELDIRPDSEACRLNRLGQLDLEKIIRDQGHNLSDCEWMSHSNPQVLTETIKL